MSDVFCERLEPSRAQLEYLLRYHHTLWHMVIDPLDIGPLIATLPRGSHYVAVRITDRDGQTDCWQVWGSRRPGCWPSRPVARERAVETLLVWLRLRRMGREVLASERWTRHLCGVVEPRDAG